MRNTEPAIRQMTVIEATGTDLPEEVKEDVQKLWETREFGNDNFYYRWTEEDFDDQEANWMDEVDKVPHLVAYLRENGIENCLIHYWW